MFFVRLFRSSSLTPSITIEPKNQTVAQGSNVEIRCNIGGISRPVIQWTKLGESLDSKVDARNPVLKLYNVQTNDRGVYVCVASNEDNYVQGSSMLEVERTYFVLTYFFYLVNINFSTRPAKNRIVSTRTYYGKRWS